MTLEESKEVIPMMEAMITQIEEQQNIMAEMLQEIQEKDEKLMCFQEQEELKISLGRQNRNGIMHSPIRKK